MGAGVDNLRLCHCNVVLSASQVAFNCGSSAESHGMHARVTLQDSCKCAALLNITLELLCTTAKAWNRKLSTDSYSSAGFAADIIQGPTKVGAVVTL